MTQIALYCTIYTLFLFFWQKTGIPVCPKRDCNGDLFCPVLQICNEIELKLGQTSLLRKIIDLSKNLMCVFVCACGSNNGYRIDPSVFTIAFENYNETARPTSEAYDGSHRWLLQNGAKSGNSIFCFAFCRRLTVPHVRQNTFGSRAFASAGPTFSARVLEWSATWYDQLRRDPKTFT